MYFGNELGDGSYDLSDVRASLMKGKIVCIIGVEESFTPTLQSSRLVGPILGHKSEILHVCRLSSVYIRSSFCGAIEPRFLPLYSFYYFKQRFLDNVTWWTTQQKTNPH